MSLVICCLTQSKCRQTNYVEGSNIKKIIWMEIFQKEKLSGLTCTVIINKSNIRELCKVIRNKLVKL